MVRLKADHPVTDASISPGSRHDGAERDLISLSRPLANFHTWLQGILLLDPTIYPWPC